MRATVLRSLLILGSLTLACALALDGPTGCSAGAASMPCSTSAAGARNEITMLLAGASASMAVALVLAFSWHALGHRRVVLALIRSARPRVLLGLEVALVDGLLAPGVAGFLRPRIYCPADLVERLSEPELRAVLLHERSHQLGHDPARLVLLAALATVLPRWDGMRPVVEGKIAGLEIAADRHALSAGAQRADLAGALLKLGSPTAGPGLAGYASASELRLRHLIGDVQPNPGQRSALLSVVLPVAALLICLLLS